jgi:hypothetical protein
MPDPKPDFKPIARKAADASKLPAGHARDEQIKVNTDLNAERIEQAAATAGALDPAAFAPDREILAFTDGLEVSDRQPGFVYSWKLFDNPKSNVGYWVNQAKIQGWQVVCGDMPEAKEHEIAGGMRKIGDCVLMRIPASRHAAIIRAEEAQAAEMAASVHSNLVELGKARGVTVKVVDNTNLDPALLTQMDARARGHMAADQKFARALRDGSLR